MAENALIVPRNAIGCLADDFDAPLHGEEPNFVGGELRAQALADQVRCFSA